MRIPADGTPVLVWSACWILFATERVVGRSTARLCWTALSALDVTKIINMKQLISGRIRPQLNYLLWRDRRLVTLNNVEGKVKRMIFVSGEETENCDDANNDNS